LPIVEFSYAVERLAYTGRIIVHNNQIMIKEGCDIVSHILKYSNQGGGEEQRVVRIPNEMDCIILQHAPL
jgi:hypothetical protein